MEIKLKLEAESMKDFYATGEDVVIRVYLFSFSDDPLWANARMALNRPAGVGEMSFHIIGPSGEVIPFQARLRIGAAERDEFAILQPWRCVGRQYDLEPNFEFYLRMPGNYRLTADYHNDDTGHDWGLDAWIGSLKAETIQFEVLA